MATNDHYKRGQVQIQNSNSVQINKTANTIHLRVPKKGKGKNGGKKGIRDRFIKEAGVIRKTSTRFTTVRVLSDSFNKGCSPPGERPFLLAAPWRAHAGIASVGLVAAMLGISIPARALWARVQNGKI